MDFSCLRVREHPHVDAPRRRLRRATRERRLRGLRPRRQRPRPRDLRLRSPTPAAAPGQLTTVRPTAVRQSREIEQGMLHAILKGLSVACRVGDNNFPSRCRPGEVAGFPAKLSEGGCLALKRPLG